MANKFTRFLNGVGRGMLTPKGIVANWQHATRIFIDDTYRLSPRTRFLFYVQFEIDPASHGSLEFTDKHSREVGLLVKSADLPKYNFDSVIKNQYNRKKIIYRQLNYEPVSITMHDDSAGIVNSLWGIYYGYYVRDRKNPTLAYDANHYRPQDINNYRYGLDNDISVPFFKSISIYTMSRRRFNGYTLINPKIKTWNHGTMSYADNDVLESTMTLEYESVQYSSGTVQQDSPKGFATLHYDNVPSPLSVAGGGTNTLTGPGGVLDGLESIFGDVSTGKIFESPTSFLGTAIKAINTYENLKGLSSDNLKQEAINILSNPGNVSAAMSTIGGVVDAVFPKIINTTAPTTATQKSLISNPINSTRF